MNLKRQYSSWPRRPERGLSLAQLQAILLLRTPDHEDNDLRLLYLSLLAAMFSIAQTADARTANQVTLIGNEGCFESDTALPKLQQVLDTHQRSSHETPKLSVGLSQSTSDVQLSLRLTNARGGLMLSRSYQLTSHDCKDIPELITLVLDEALKTLPIEAWEKEPIADGSGDQSPPRLTLLSYSEATSFSAALAGGIQLPIWQNQDGTPIELSVGIELGLGPTFELSEGKASESTLQLNLGAHVTFDNFVVSGLIQAGAARYKGISTPDPSSTWLPYLGAGLEVGIEVNRVLLFSRLTSPILRHQLTVVGSEDQRSLAPLRLGFGLSLPL